MADELLPCPFCGAEAETFQRDEIWGDSLKMPPIEHVVRCSNMDCHVFPEVAEKTFDEAVKHWNTRFDWANKIPDKQKVVDFLKELLESCRVRSINADEEYSLVEELLKNLK